METAASWTAGKMSLSTCGCACLPSPQLASSNRRGRTGLNPDNGPDDVGFVDDDHLSDTG
jgi:hypothetical protein